MTTKEQERAAVEKIRKIIEELGENSYVGFAMEGVLELAEENIREDTAYSMKKRAELIEERAREAEKENKLLKAELGTAKKITEENNKVIAKLKADVCELKANEVPEELIKEMYSIEANSVIVLGKRVGVAGMTIQPGETGSLHVKGVFRFEKDDSEITAGAEVYVTAAGKMTTTASGNTAAGFATEAAKAAETSVLVNINA